MADEKKPNKAKTPTKANYGADDPEDNRSTEYPVVYSFPQTHPIFWGPTQDTQYVDGESGYQPPSPAAFNDRILMTIPVVIRGITGHNTAYSPPPVPPVPPTGPGHCVVGDSGTLVVGYQQGIDGVYGVSKSSKFGKIIPGYYDEEHGYPNGIPCGGGFGTFFTYMKEFVIVNDVSENYGPFNDIHGVPQSTEQLLSRFLRFPAHNKGSWQGYTGPQYAELSIATEIPVNIGGGPAPGVYQTGCFGRGLGTAPFALSSGEIVPLPSAGYPAGEGPTLPESGNVIVSYYINSGGDPKFTIFWFINCLDMSRGVFLPGFAMFPGWISKLPPQPFNRYNRPGQVPGPVITMGPLEPGDDGTPP